MYRVSTGAKICGAYAFCSAILITPHLPVVGYKLTLPDFVFVILIAYFALSARNNDSSGKIKINSVATFFFLVLLLFVVSCYFSVLFNGISYVGQDYITYMSIEFVNYIYGFILSFITCLLLNSKEDIYCVIKCWIFGSIVLGFGSFLAFMGVGGDLFIDDFSGRISSTMRAINQVPSFVAPALAFSLALSFNTFNEKLLNIKWIVLGCVFSIIALLATGSRTSLGMAVLVFLSLLVYSYFFPSSKKKNFSVYRFLLTTGFISTLVTYFMVGFFYISTSQDLPALFRPIQLMLTWQTGILDVTDTTRIEQIEVGLKSINDYPLFGIGPGAFMPRHHMNEIHNSFLGVAVGQGILGISLLIILIGLLIAIVSKGIQVTSDLSMKIIGFSLLVAFISLVGYAFFVYGMRQRNFWLIIGLILAYYKVSILNKHTLNSRLTP
ncbi:MULTISPECIES: O-antigen ligase family protein [unclassified Cobetia]|uniref:O-antigen ligase family protein n=1 Tax=unclassified Cobetia TaxID=2609414 RepID=UPI00178C924D|nr:MULTISPECIES: O-antigen ligase family protein [unclassified Cobetia]MBE2170232.1 O-antigen ligase family protein [Cobetia sp. 2AS1]MDH2446986.1 O-antigen ligase family protein [Cobetia sp. 2AS]